MKRALFALCACLLPAHALAQQDPGFRPDGDGRFSIGLFAGEPIGATAGLRIDDRFAIHLDAGASTSDRIRAIAAADVVYTLPDVMGPVGQTGLLAPWVGVGLRYSIARQPVHPAVPIHNLSDHFGFRVPLGVSYMASDAPIEVFIEIAPGLGFIPGALAAIDGGLGVRVGF
jgi:hypothetical protein